MTSTNKEAGLLVLNSFNLLADPDEKHDDSVIKKAQIMGWCVEMVSMDIQKPHPKKRKQFWDWDYIIVINFVKTKLSNDNLPFFFGGGGLR